MQSTVDDRIHRIVSDVFGVPLDKIDENTSPDTAEEWDSHGHVNLILALEAEFDISLTPEDAMEMLSVKLIGLILADLGLEDDS